MIFINFSKNFSKFFHRFLKNPLGSENFEKFFIIFKNRKKFFDKNENYQLDDAASEKSIKNRIPNIYGVIPSQTESERRWRMSKLSRVSLLIIKNRVLFYTGLKLLYKILKHVKDRFRLLISKNKERYDHKNSFFSNSSLLLSKLRLENLFLFISIFLTFLFLSVLF